jgi:protein-disulfide isomerase
MLYAQPGKYLPMRGGAADRALQLIATAVVFLGIGFASAHFLQSAAPGSSAASAAAPAVPKVESIVAEYIRTHPEAIVAALDAERARHALQGQYHVTAALQAHRAELFADTASPTMGDPRGDVDVAEFFDFRCPYCKTTAPLLERLVARDRHVRIVFKNLPILGADSDYAARLGLAAARAGRFGDFYRAVFANVPAHGDRTAIDKAVRSIGLDPAALDARSHTAEIEALVQRDRQLAGTLGIAGTPALVIGDQLLAEAPTLETLDAAVSAARRR